MPDRVPETTGGERRRILDEGHQLRRPAHFAFSFIATAYFLFMAYVMVSIAIYLVSGLWSLELLGLGQPYTETQLQSALSAAANGPGGEDGVKIRMAVAALVCIAPVLLAARNVGGRHLIPWEALDRTASSLLTKWAGLAVASIVFGAIAGVSGVI